MFVDPSNLESHEDSRHPRRAGQTDPALLTTLKHAASMPHSLFYERKCRRTSTRSMPQLPASFDESLDGGLILPCGLHDTVAMLADQVSGRLEVTTTVHKERHRNSPFMPP